MTFKFGMLIRLSNTKILDITGDPTQELGDCRTGHHVVATSHKGSAEAIGWLLTSRERRRALA